MGPAEVVTRFASLMSAGDVDGAAALYEPNAAFVVEPGQVVVGQPAIRSALEQFAALRPTLSGSIEQVVTTDDVALVVNRWTLDGTAPDGAPVHLQGTSADVLRKIDAGWRITIDDPWGGANE